MNEITESHAGHERANRRRLADFSGAGYEKGRSLLWQACWFAVLNVAFIKWWLPPRWRPLILRAFGAQIGDRVFIRHRVRILWPWKLSIGDDTWVGEDAWILNLETVTIGQNVCVSQSAFLCTGSHDARSETFEYDNGPITIGSGAWIAAGALVLRGSEVPPMVVVPARAVFSASH